MGGRIYDVKIWCQTSDFAIWRQIGLQKSFLGNRVTYMQLYDFSLVTKVFKCILMEEFGFLLVEYRAYIVIIELFPLKLKV